MDFIIFILIEQVLRFYIGGGFSIEFDLAYNTLPYTNNTNTNIVNVGNNQDNVGGQLKVFSELRDKGIINEEEFNKKKEELLK